MCSILQPTGVSGNALATIVCLIIWFLTLTLSTPLKELCERFGYGDSRVMAGMLAYMNFLVGAPAMAIIYACRWDRAERGCGKVALPRSLSEAFASLWEPEPGATGTKCAVCMDNEIEVAFEPCGHACCCTECAAVPKRRRVSPPCPVCRGAITARKRIYITGY